MKAVVAILIGLFIFMYVAEGVILNPFAISNAAPLLICYALYRRGCAIPDQKLVWGALGFLVGSMAVSAPFHIAWMFDWGQIKSGSSTAGLALLFVPIYACIAGGLGFLLGWLARHLGPHYGT